MSAVARVTIALPKSLWEATCQLVSPHERSRFVASALKMEIRRRKRIDSSTIWFNLLKPCAQPGWMSLLWQKSLQPCGRNETNNYKLLTPHFLLNHAPRIPLLHCRSHRPQTC